MFRDDPSSYRRVRWRPLESSENLVLDPIVVLMIHALRNGLIKGGPRTIEDILQQISAEPSQTLIWENPTWPVIPAITSSATALIFPKPAGVHQLHNSLIDAARSGGMLKHPWSHDLRRGSAKDNKQLKGIVAGADLQVAASLGHSNTAHQRGTTDLYAERESFFIPNAREQQLREDPFGPQFAETPYRKPARLSPHVINEAAKKSRSYAHSSYPPHSSGLEAEMGRRGHRLSPYFPKTTQIGDADSFQRKTSGGRRW